MNAWPELYRKRLKARLLALFARWMNERDFRDTTLQTLLDYCAYLNAKHRADSARTTVTYRSRQFRVVVNFCAFLHERGKLFVDPGADFPVLHKPQCLPRRVLTHAQRLRLLGQPNTQTALGYRDRAVLETLYSCGLRSLELCKLTVYDLELPARCACAAAKETRTGFVPFGATAASYVRKYVAQERPLLLARSRRKLDVDRLFLNQQGRARDTNALRHLVRRHTQELLGPSHLTTTPNLHSRRPRRPAAHPHRDRPGRTPPQARRADVRPPRFRDQKNHARF